MIHCIVAPGKSLLVDPPPPGRREEERGGGGETQAGRPAGWLAEALETNTSKYLFASRPPPPPHFFPFFVACSFRVWGSVRKAGGTWPKATPEQLSGSLGTGLGSSLYIRMSRHEGVSCDACLKGNFRGRRYKCLICYDYDLCATCYESGATTTRHTTDHPMQCILTRVDFDLYYGGEAFSVEQPQSFTCPYCGKMGYTETSLQEHVASEHAETSTEICPICAALPGGDPNHVTDDFAAHLTLEHRAPRDLDESSGVRHVRRMFHPGRGLGGPRARRSNMHFTSSSSSGLSSSQSSYSPSNRETMDPIAELLSQLSGVRRSAGQLNSSGPSASQLQQLQMQLQLERQHAQAARQQLETARNATRRANTSSIPTTLTQSIAATNTSNTENNHQTIQNSQFLLMRLNDPKMSEAERQSKESEQADHSLFVQELLLSTLMQEESSSSDEDERGEIADFGAMGCVDIMPLDVALENLNLKENNKGNEPPL
ncbi:E3 ubiquitin-protein ligase KCMF1-like isoform X2 [Ammospiza nelsoni]|uniref:E3 ubiquitin-protein ligase KCMF1-like isoform X2 n=1 Tax=Ammospiza nelsoni TaxID=2857394 RepID=UPI00286ADAC3|nr:E3 ubiquitin-protein ligase KCMF1-like isoform X2 [Ammospiza nelsoni]